MAGIGIGVGRTGYPVPPPSEPCVRFSRTRLSSRWFTAERIDRPPHGLWSRCTAHARQGRRPDVPPFTPCSSAVNMRPVQTLGSVHAQGPSCRRSPRRLSCPALLALAPFGQHCRRCRFRGSSHHASTFLRPLAPRALPRFVATTDALTSPWPALRALDRAMNTLMTPRRSPCFTCMAFRPFRRQPPHAAPPLL